MIISIFLISHFARALPFQSFQHAEHLTTVRLYQTIIILLLILCHSLDALAAADEFALCKPFAEIAPPRPDLQPPEDDSIHLFADEAIVLEKLGTSTASGDVLMQRGEQILKTPVVVYDRNNDIADAEKDFTFWDNDFVISGASVQLRPDNQGEMKNAEYWLLKRRARGRAAKIIKESKDIIHLEQTSYSTCDPKSEVWRLNAGRLTLDEAKAVGTARDVTIRLWDIPVFYFPYLSFSLSEQRKSGVLMPNVGMTDETGVEMSIPYYFNLAPHYDATLTPRIMSRRGFLLNSEFRYLTQATGGNLNVEYLPQDQVLGQDRSSLLFKHNGQISKRWRADLDINYVSDERYFADLGNNINVSSITHLEQRGDLAYLGDGWSLQGRLHKFQTLDPNPAARPYQRLPQLLFKTNLPTKNRQFNLGLQAEWVRFDRNTDVVKGATGNRLDMESAFSFPWRTPGTFVVPKLSLRYTGYHLDNVATDENTTPDRFLFTFSTDSGLFFDRNVNWRGRGLVQTLEPRLFYRYTPYQDQNDIPIFDTAEYDLSFLQLFRENNFIGADRVDDGHQVTLGMTSRLLGSNTGVEHLRASLGQIYYFRDRRVTLPDQPVYSDASSTMVMELATQPAKSWRVSSTVQWNPHTNDTERTIVRMRYQPNSERIFNTSYRLRDSIIEQTDISFYWSLNPRWKLLGRWNYSLPNKNILETFGGLEYNSCCWAVRFIAQRYLNSADGFDYSNGFFLQFQLKGLGNIGRKTDSFLEQRIPGYSDNF
ncbi:MAG: LPS-assembly protein LptD [Candidatus Parabeggiatoa sp. nov. 1]|nr:MAG: LPS-assembly protein LptD [Gammaproteobacteria bacterium]